MASKISLSLLFVSFVSAIAAGFLIFQRYLPVPEMPQTNSSSSEISTEVIRLVIPELDMSLPVYPASISGTRWDYSSRGVSFLTTSARPDQVGNSVFYGHNWPNIFAPLHKAKIGDEVFLQTGEKDFRYQISYIEVVSAGKTEILDQTGESKLTIFTCTGFLDSKRLVITALPL